MSKDYFDVIQIAVDDIKKKVGKIKADGKITLGDLREIYDIVVDAVMITEAISKIVPNWDKDKKDVAVKIIDDAIDLGKFNIVLGAIDKTNVDRILIGYLVDQVVAVLNKISGKDWEKISDYVDVFNKYKGLIESVIDYIDTEE